MLLFLKNAIKNTLTKWQKTIFYDIVFRPDNQGDFSFIHLSSVLLENQDSQ